MKYTWSDIFINLQAYAEGFLLLIRYHRQDQVPPETTPIENIRARIAGNITGQLAVGHGITQFRIPTLLSTIFTMRHRSPIYETEPAEVLDVAAEIESDIGGQVAIGRNIFQLYIAPLIGSLIEIHPRPRLFSRSSPIDMRPRAFPDLVNRQTEISIATNALRTRQLVEFYGQHGIGKSVLLRFLAHQPFTASFRDGVIYLPIDWEAKEELLQFIFDAFYDSKPPYMPPKAEIQVRLHDKQALLLLDNENLAQGEVKALINTVPNSAFLIVSAKRRLAGEGRALALSGLPPEDALTLLESHIARSLSQPERSEAQQLCDTLERHPLYIVGAATMIDAGRSPTELATLSVTTLMVQIIMALPEMDRRVIGMLAAVGGVPLATERIIELTGVAEANLERLLQPGLVQSQASYHVSDTVAQAIAQVQDLNPLREQALAYFLDWTEANQQNFDLILESVDAILVLLAWAVEAGRWSDVLRLVRAVEGALASGKRWMTWEQVLQWGRQAAETLNDQAALAWSWHQLGSRALCLNEISSAFFFLYQALRLRETLGDTIGAAVTRHNLYLLLLPPPTEGAPPPPRNGPIPGSFFTWLLILLPIIVAAVVILTLAQLLNTPQPPIITYVTVTPTLPTTVPPLNIAATSPPMTPTETEEPLSPTSLPPTVTSVPPTVEAASPPTPIPPTPIPPTPPIPVPIIAVSSTDLNFGTQMVGTTSQPQSVTVANLGSGNLIVSNSQFLGVDYNDFTQDNNQCVGVGLAPSQSCTIRVSFKPSDVGDRGTSLSINHNGPTGVAYVILRGVGEAFPILQIVKDDGGITAAPGEIIPYTLTYSNTGNQNATGVVITETVPANTTFLGIVLDNAAALVVNNSSSGWSCPNRAPAGTVCTLNVGTLPADASRSAIFPVTVNYPVPAGVTEISNTAFIGDDRPPNTESDSDTTPLNIQGPSLKIKKDDGGIEEFRPGQPITYTLTYTNTGDQNATGVVITETVPSSTIFNGDASTPGWMVAGTTDPCDDHPAGTECILAIGTVTGGGDGGSVKFVVTVNQ